MTRLDASMEPGGSPEPSGISSEDVRVRAEERALKRITDPTDLYELVSGLELDIWPMLAEAMRNSYRAEQQSSAAMLHLNAAGFSVRGIMRLALARAIELETPQARRDLIYGRNYDAPRRRMLPPHVEAEYEDEWKLDRRDRAREAGR